MNERLPRPAGIEGPDLWIEESIWGHRFYDEQSPWLTILEFLTILLAETDAGRALKEDTPNSLAYRPQQQLNVRNVLFNNPYLEAIRIEECSDEEKWQKWNEKMTSTAGGIQEDTDFLYLRVRFGAFDDFARVVGFLRATAIEYDSNKRWSSKFIFPFGRNSLYEDLLVRKNSTTNDRRFFARSGELLYLMMCRSKKVDELREKLLDRLVNADENLDKLSKALQGEPTHAQNKRGGAYLPYGWLEDYDYLAEDWLSILALPMPIYDTLPHIVALTGLHLVRYLLGRSRAELDQSNPVQFLCEIVGPRRTVIRDLSADSYQENNSLPRQAMERHIRRVSETEEWKNALGSRDPLDEATELLEECFDWQDKDRDAISNASLESLLDNLVEKASRRHNQHVGKVHSSWARDVGLASRRASRRNRYAPHDQLLKTLVICRVKTRMEFNEFLSDIADHYGLIIGDEQAEYWIKKGLADQEDFSNNARRLESRLASLGLLNRLSDSCAYVENPFRRADKL